MAPKLCINSTGLINMITATNKYFGASRVDPVRLKKCLEPSKSKSKVKRTIHLKQHLRKLQRMIRKKSEEPNRHRTFWRELARILPKAATEAIAGNDFEMSNRPVVPRSLVTKKIAREQARALLNFSVLRKPVPFWFAAPELSHVSTKKLAEGSWGEIYLIRGPNDSERVIKCIPVGGVNPFNGEKQLSYADVLPEITSSITLSSLEDGLDYRAANYPTIHKVCCVQDSFPKKTLRTWNRFKRAHGSCHCRPDAYGPEQAYITIETDMCGTAVDFIKLKDSLKACSIFMQTAAAVAVAEEAFLFEHRDLHIGNLLVRDCEKGMLEYRLGGQSYYVNNYGVFVSIIDYTYARISTEEGVRFLDLEGLISPERNSTHKYLDNRYVYSKMEDANKKKWDLFNPISNNFWMKHVSVSLKKKLKEDLVHFKEEIMKDKEQIQGVLLLDLFDDAVLLYPSVSSFVREHILCSA